MKYLFIFNTYALRTLIIFLFFVPILEVQCLLLFYFFNAIFMLAKIEFPFTELTKGESLKQILRTVDLPTSKKGPQKETKKSVLFQDKNM